MKKIKKPVLILYPPFEGRFFLKSRLPFPIGPLTIASFLTSNGIECHVKDFSYPAVKTLSKRPKGVNTKGGYYRYGASDVDILAWLETNLPKYHKSIGISSLMSTCYHSAYNLARLVKSVSTDCETIIGGPHACINPEHVTNCKHIDKVCLGEGEIPFYDYLVKGKSKYIVDAGSVRRGSRNCELSDMDTLQHMDRRLLLDDRKVDHMMVAFSRGCPQHCTFCTSFLIQGRRWRHMSAERAVDMVVHLQKEWDVHQFEIEDDNLCPGSEGIRWLTEFCKLVGIKKEEGELLSKTRFHVPHGLPVHSVATAGIADMLWAAGFRDMVFPVESTDRAVLKEMRKGGTPENWRKANRAWNKYEKKVPVEVIIGYPFVQSIATMLRTFMDIADEGGLIWASHFRLNTRTLLFDRCVDAGYVKGDYDPLSMNSFSIETERFTIADLLCLLRISRGINFGTTSGFNSFRDDPAQMNKGLLKFTFKKKLAKGSAIAHGSFGFLKGQSTFASIVASRMIGTELEPIIGTSDSKKELLYQGSRPNRVFAALHLLLEESNLICGGVRVDKGLLNFMGGVK